jgi:hypothetical protein
MKRQFLFASFALTLVLVGCGNMNRASLQDKIQSDANKRAGRYVVASVHCKSDHSVPDESDMCIVQPAYGNPIGLLVHIDGNGYRILQPPTQLK